MAKTTNILDLNNRLEKVEKENVAQNSYTSLKNKPKINSHILTGDKSSSDLGLAAAGDITDINTAIGNMSDLDTTATDLVGAVNEVNDGLSKLNSGIVNAYPIITPNNYAAVSLPKATAYTILGIYLLGDPTPIPEATGGVTDGYIITAKSEAEGYLLISLVGSYASVNAGSALSLVINIQ